MIKSSSMKNFSFAALLLLVACNSTRNIAGSNSALPVNTVINGKLFTALYQQKAAEYRALCYQGYNIARWQIDNYQPVSNKPKAIITDIDETILDNSPYAVHQALQGKDYEAATWYQWTDKSAADTMPGAGALLRYAASKGIEVFYITNREERERGSTLQNLQRFGLPNTDNAHFIPKATISSKEQRRQTVMATHEVILLMGDNLADFSLLFDKKTVAERKQNTDANYGAFGKKFIVFPNPGYGDWESSMNQYKYSFTAAQKDSIIRANVTGY
ncbi:MAG: 5-nucleotidase, lipoprotein e(P4) family [Ferruginibacter sp.]|nr:5-nucleotidase, lipoprotein e(P4) family [Ferruginibacter sp.]